MAPLVLILDVAGGQVEGLLQELLHSLIMFVRCRLERLLQQSLVRHSRVFRAFDRLLRAHRFFLHRFVIALLLRRQHLRAPLVQIIFDVLADS